MSRPHPQPGEGSKGKQKKKLLERLESFQKCQSDILEQVCSHMRLLMPVCKCMRADGCEHGVQGQFRRSVSTYGDRFDFPVI